jgi:hypothetical protein
MFHFRMTTFCIARGAGATVWRESSARGTAAAQPALPSYSQSKCINLLHRVLLPEMKQDKCVCPLSWSVHCNFTGDGKCNERGWACTPPPSPAWANFTLMIECTPESSSCYSVYSVICCVSTFELTENIRLFCYHGLLID